MITLPTSLADLNKLITDQVQENIHLDYKESPAIDKSKRNEIAKDVSAFANSDGGVLVYGVVESNNLPVSVDGGVGHTTYSREWLEQIINSNISPRIDDIRISPIQLSVDRSAYAVKIPKSFRGPHQAPDKKYYKRFNFQSVPMEDYEINDVRNRRKVLPPLVNVDIEIEQGLLIYLSVTNIGDQTAEDITFNLPAILQPWIDKEGPNFFTRGIKYLPPNRNYRIMYAPINQALHDSSPYPSRFDISVSYNHPEANQRISDEFHFDLMDYWNTSVIDSELYQHGKKVKESIDKLTIAINNLNKNVESLTPLTGATGLNLSVSTVKNLHHLAADETQTERINPEGAGYRVFMEVLGVDSNIALQLRNFFRSRDDNKKLEEVEGVTAELIEEMEKYFHVESYLSTPNKELHRTPRLRASHVALLVIAGVLLARRGLIRALDSC
jgi:hypothetical protein